MSNDGRGMVMTGSPEAVGAYDRAIDHLVRFQIEVVEDAATAMAADPSCAMGGVLNAYLSLMSTEEIGVAPARDALAALTIAEDGLLPRERAHRAAARRLVEGDMRGAGALLNGILMEHPRDLLGLVVGHQIDFFSGNAANLRDRVGRCLYAWGADDPQFGFVLGMYAFGLEECNLYGLSEEVGRSAVTTNPDDVWGLHAVVHTYEMTGRIPEGVRFMQAREDDWGAGNFLNVHNSWHYALFLLEAGDVPGALSVYDRTLHHDDSGDVALELLDATALLWRLHLEGTPVGGRWRPLADAWTRSLSPGYYPFNDMHAAMAFIGAGDLGRAHDLVVALERFLDQGDPSTTGWAMTATVGLAICRGLVHFAEGSYEAVLDELLPIRGHVHEFGGSHAQRDAVERTLLEAAIRAGRRRIALALVSERLGVRESSTYAWSKRSQILAGVGDRGAADLAAARSEALAGAIRAVSGN
jgi:hypothetical protein